MLVRGVFTKREKKSLRQSWRMHQCSGSQSLWGTNNPLTGVTHQLFTLGFMGMVLRGTQNGAAFDIFWHIVGTPTIEPLTNPGCLEPLATGLLTCIPRRLGNHLNLHMVCAQADFKGFALWGLRSLWDCLKQRSMSAGSMVVHVCQACVQQDQADFPYRGAENRYESVEGTSRVRKQNKYVAFLSN